MWGDPVFDTIRSKYIILLIFKMKKWNFVLFLISSCFELTMYLHNILNIGYAYLQVDGSEKRNNMWDVCN